MNNPVPKAPPPPDNLGPCSSCAKWRRDTSFKVVIINAAQAAPYDEFTRNGNIPPADAVKLMSQCTANPQWSMQLGEHWCWQYMQREAASLHVLDMRGIGDQTKN